MLYLTHAAAQAAFWFRECTKCCVLQRMIQNASTLNSSKFTEWNSWWYVFYRYNEYDSARWRSKQSDLRRFSGTRPRRIAAKGRRHYSRLYESTISQAKGKDTANLSELCFIRHCSIQSQQAGVPLWLSRCPLWLERQKRIKQSSRIFLKKHTLEGVISLNKDTFYRVGTVPCIAVFYSRRTAPSG